MGWKWKMMGRRIQGTDYTLTDMARDMVVYFAALMAIIGWILAAVLWMELTGAGAGMTGVRGTGFKCAPYVSCSECWDRCDGWAEGPFEPGTNPLTINK
jgi:hypothetical protein